MAIRVTRFVCLYIILVLSSFLETLGPFHFFVFLPWLVQCCVLFYEKKKNVKLSVTQSCLTLRNSMDCSLLGSSVHGLLHARILEWVAISFSRGSSWPRDRTHVSCIGRLIISCYLFGCALPQLWQAESPVSGI